MPHRQQDQDAAFSRGRSTSPRSSDTSLSRPINPASLTANPETPSDVHPRIRPGFREAKGSRLATTRYPQPDCTVLPGDPDLSVEDVTGAIAMLTAQ